MKIATLGLFLFLAVSVGAQAPKTLTEQAYSATALLYAQDESGGMRMKCTATAFEKTDVGYLFASAAHCVASDDIQHERVEVEKTHFYVTFDERDDKKFYPARIKAVGYQHRGEDFSIFAVTTQEKWEWVPLGDEKKEAVGAELINVASPGALGKQIFHGYISSLFVDRPLIEGDINWRGTMFLQIESGPGSSGSALVAVDQRAIVAFLVGHASGSIVAMPVSRFLAFRKAVADGKYKWFDPSRMDDAAGESIR